MVVNTVTQEKFAQKLPAGKKHPKLCRNGQKCRYKEKCCYSHENFKNYKQKSEYDTLKSLIVKIQKQLNERDTNIVELEKTVKAQ